MGDKFELLAFSQADVVHGVNQAGAEFAEDVRKNKGFLEQIVDTLTGQHTAMEAAREAVNRLNLDTHEGRAEFLSKKLGIDRNTPDNYRLVGYTNDSGQKLLFKGHMEGDKKLVLTGSITLPDLDNAANIPVLLQSSFKEVKPPIEVKIEKSEPAKGGQKLDILPEEQRKLESKAAFAMAIQKSGAVELTSNAKFPSAPKGVDVGRWS